MEFLNRKRIESGIFINDYNISFEEGKISIISGRPNTGKTCLMLEIAMNMFVNQVPVKIFSLELIKQNLLERFLSIEKNNIVNKSVSELKFDYEFNISRILSIISDNKWSYSNSNFRIIIDDILLSLNKNRTKVFFIDYFQLVEFDREISFETLRILVEELNIILIILFINEIDCHDFLKNREVGSVTEFILENAYYLDVIINLNKDTRNNIILTAYQNGNLIGSFIH